LSALFAAARWEAADPDTHLDKSRNVLGVCNSCRSCCSSGSRDRSRRDSSMYQRTALVERQASERRVLPCREGTEGPLQRHERPNAREERSLAPSMLCAICVSRAPMSNVSSRSQRETECSTRTACQPKGLCNLVPARGYSRRRGRHRVRGGPALSESFLRGGRVFMSP
jgi:hypothetical protein